ncbi:MAG: glycosyltransferase family 39 protein [Patescibacteria group bacterium]
MAVFQLTSIRGEVQTIDEGVHLAAGVSYWQTGDYRLNEEHPPLVKLLAALPVILSKPKLDFTSASWQEGNQWAFAREMLYQRGNDADRLLFLGRLPMVGLCLLLGFMLYLWGRRLGGDLAGILALGWFSFDPNFLAHGRYITTDVPIALGYAATLYLLLRVLEKWSWQRLAVFAAVFGLTQVTKFSALFLYAILLLAPVLWYYKSASVKIILQRTAALLGVGILGTALAVLVVYGGQVKRGSDDPWVQALYQERLRVIAEQRQNQQPQAIQRIISLTDPAHRTGKVVQQLVMETLIPGWSYFKGIALVLNHDFWGHLAYLNGQHSNFGWWWYFPFAGLVKTPLATLIMFSLAIVALAKTGRQAPILHQRSIYLLAGTCLLYLLWSMTSNLNLGLRHVFPVYAIIFALIGVFLANVLQTGKHWLMLTSIGISALYITSSVLAYPTYTGYFSEVIGGSANGPKYLVDSNVDRGQDAKRLITYLRARNIPYVCMSYFGQASLDYYGLDNRYLPTETDPHDTEAIQCVVAISVYQSPLARPGIRLATRLRAGCQDRRIDIRLRFSSRPFPRPRSRTISLTQPAVFSIICIPCKIE